MNRPRSRITTERPSERVATEPSQLFGKSPDSHQNSNRHLRCIAELLHEREDQKKWMKNLRSKYLNDRNKLKPIYDRAQDIINIKEYRLQQEKTRVAEKAMEEVKSPKQREALTSPRAVNKSQLSAHQTSTPPKSRKDIPERKSTFIRNQPSTKKVGRMIESISIPGEYDGKLSNDPYAKPETTPNKLVIDSSLQTMLRQASPTYMRPYQLHPYSFTPRYHPRAFFDNQPHWFESPTYRHTLTSTSQGLHRKYRYLENLREEDGTPPIHNTSRSPHGRNEQNPEHSKATKPNTASKRTLLEKDKSSDRSRFRMEPKANHKPSTSEIRSLLEHNKKEIMDFLADFVHQHS